MSRAARPIQIVALTWLCVWLSASLFGQTPTPATITTTTGTFSTATMPPTAPYTFTTTPPNWTTGPNESYFGNQVSLGAAFPTSGFLQDNQRFSALASTVVVDSSSLYNGEGSALDGYALSKSTNTDVIAIVGTSEAGANGGGVWAGNLVAFDL